MEHAPEQQQTEMQKQQMQEKQMQPAKEQQEVKQPEKVEGMHGVPVEVTIGELPYSAQAQGEKPQPSAGRSIGQESEQGQPPAHAGVQSQIGQQTGMTGITPMDIQPSRTLQQHEQGQQQQQGLGGAQQQQPHEKELGAGEGIKIQPLQREVSGLLKEGTGEPDTVDARGTLAVHQERAAIDHSKDDSARHPDAPVDYIDTKESEGYKSREQAGKTRMP